MGELVIDVSERTSTLIREEIELAKTEVREKIQKLLQGSVVGIAAGVFVLMALAMLMHGIAWLLNDLFFSGRRLCRLPDRGRCSGSSSPRSPA